MTHEHYKEEEGEKSLPSGAGMVEIEPEELDDAERIRQQKKLKEKTPPTDKIPEPAS